jgi:hypothetical protein
MAMQAEIAEAMERNSLPDLVYFACVHARHPRTAERVGRCPALGEVNEALLTVIARADHSERDLAPQIGDTLQPLVWQPPTPAARLEDLAYLLKMPDAPELAPAVEAAASRLLDHGAAGRTVLYSRALLASECMRGRVARLFEERGDERTAQRLRKSRR